MNPKRPALRLFIDGGWIEAEARATTAVLNPATGAELGRLPMATEADLDAAMAAAERGFETWRKVPALERSRLLRRAADWLRERREDWAGLISQELGKPIGQARIETDTALDMFEWAAEEARRLYGRQIPSRSANLRLTAVVDPVGPVAAISGWNAPAITPSRKIAGALAAGCSVVIKPSEATPSAALMVAQALEAAGLPPGVLGMVFGDPPTIGRRFATDPVIRMITFTGGTGVGKSLAALCSGTLKRMVLELGGHAPALVFADVDIEAVAAAAVTAKYRNGGQICTAPTRFMVQRPVYDAFVERFAAGVRDLKLGDPFDPATQMGPLQNRARVAATAELLADAKVQGAAVVSGTAPSGEGFWCAPAAVIAPPLTLRAQNEEPFGPIALISPFDSANEAIAEANRLPFGLAAYAFTGDLKIAERLGREAQAGSLAINHWVASLAETPFGGVKESGLGTEGGAEGLAAFTQTRFVSVAS